jgi:hypothetical protein
MVISDPIGIFIFIEGNGGNWEAAYRVRRGCTNQKRVSGSVASTQLTGRTGGMEINKKANSSPSDRPNNPLPPWTLPHPPLPTTGISSISNWNILDAENVE